MTRADGGRSPASKLLLAILIGAALSIPLFFVWLLVYDRQSQSEEARASITEGWGGPQVLAGPILVIPYRTNVTESLVEAGKTVTRSRQISRELSLAPEAVELSSDIHPQRRKRSIYEAVVYDARMTGRARFVFPPDLTRHGVSIADMDLARAELRFGISDPKGLGANPRVTINGRGQRLQPGGGSRGGRGFFAWIDAAALAAGAIAVDYAFDFRGNSSITLAPQAGDTRWTVKSTWPHPSFSGDFLPAQRQVSDKGFAATYRVGNLALGQSLISTGDPGSSTTVERVRVPAANPYMVSTDTDTGSVNAQAAAISLIQPVDLYSRVDRAAKYGFLFIGFTFLALLMFDVIGGVRVSAVEYLLMGAALVLFFVLLLAFAEVIGFALAYVLASVAIAGLNTAYSAAVLKSWRRAWFIGGLLIGLYAVLYILLSLEAYSLLIGSLLLFAALAGVMYLTRRIDWGARSETAE